MEPTTVFFIFFGLALFVIFISSSNGDEHQSPREDSEHQNNHFYPRPDYPAWGSPPDWRDWQYDYYRRPRIYRISSVLKAVVTTFFACLVLMAVVYIFTKVLSAPPKSTELQPKEVPTETTQSLKAQIQKVEIKPRPKEYVRQPYHLYAKSRAMDLTTARDVQKFYLPLEILRSSEDEYNIVVFTDNNEDLDKFIRILRSDEALKGYKLDFKFHNVPEKDKGEIIREKGTDIWFYQK